MCACVCVTLKIFWQYRFNFFDFSKVFLLLSDDCHVKTAWNQWLKKSIHAIKYIYIYIHIYIYIYIYIYINGSGDQGSIPGSFIPKTQKMVLKTSLLNSQHYTAYIKVNPGKGVAPSPKPRYSTYWKRGFRDALDCGRQLTNMVSSN